MLNDRYLAAPDMPNLDTRSDPSLLPVPAVRPKVVLVEPDTIRVANRTSHLLEERYCVTVAKDVRELFLLRDGEPFHIALLSDHLGSFQLVAAAHSVRRQWPDAHILVLGQAAVMLEDHLYDDAIAHSCKQEDLLASLTKLSCNPWRQRAEGRPFIVQTLKPEQAVKRAKEQKSFEGAKDIMARPA
jgi:DNA-binding response OmpR family regulator